SLNQPATLMRGRLPNIITAPLICSGPIYYDFSPGFNLSFVVTGLVLPVENLNVHPFLVTDPVGDFNHPFDMGHWNSKVAQAAWDSAVDAVDAIHLWNDPFQGNDEHFLGMVHPKVTQSTGIAGNGARPGKATAAIMGDYWSGKTVAHELGHNYGRRHLNCGTFPPDQADFD